MPVSGLVITLADEPSEASLRAHLEHEPLVMLGEREGRYLPLVLETATAKQGEHVCEQLRDLPGVLALNVVFIDFSEPELESGQEA